MVEEKQMIICHKCGSKMNPHAKFCKNCGTKVDPDNVKLVAEDEVDMVDTIEESNRNEELVVDTSSSEETPSTSSVDFESIIVYFFNYLNFLKETLIKPSSVFEMDQHSWVFGTVSIVLFSLFSTFLISGDFWSGFFVNIIFQLAFVSLLFMLNKYFLSGEDIYLEVLGKYGGLMNTQIILILMLNLIDSDSFLVLVFLPVFLLNQLNIFNLYIFNIGPKNKEKMDYYYQVLISYVVVIVASFAIFALLADVFYWYGL